MHQECENRMIRHPRLRGHMALAGLLLLLPISNAAGVTWEVLDQMQVNQPAVVYSSVTIVDAAPTHAASLWVSTSVTTPHVYVSTTGLVGIGTSNPGARLDVVSTGTTANDYVQIWRNSGGTIVASMSATGVMTALSAEAITGSVVFFNLSTCPPGWTDMTSTWGGRYIVGLMPGGTLGQVVGTQLGADENRPAGQHNHATGTETDHLHGSGAYIVAQQGRPVMATTGYLQEGYSGNTSDDKADIAVNSSSVVGGPPQGTNAPYVALLLCKKD